MALTLSVPGSMPDSLLRRRWLGRLGLSVVGCLALVGWDLVELAVQTTVVVPVDHSMVAYSISSRVHSGPVRNGLAGPTASVLNKSIVVSEERCRRPRHAADRCRNPFQHKRFSKAIDVYCDPYHCEDQSVIDAAAGLIARATTPSPSRCSPARVEQVAVTCNESLGGPRRSPV